MTIHDYIGWEGVKCVVGVGGLVSLVAFPFVVEKLTGPYPNKINPKMVKDYGPITKKEFFAACGVLLLPLVILWFPYILHPFSVTTFANDGPFGWAMAQHTKDANVWGHWNDLNWLGFADLPAMPHFSYGMYLLCVHPVVGGLLILLYVRIIMFVRQVLLNRKAKKV